jgi:hypothetical protein
MKDYYQYRITVNDSTGPILDENPAEQWSKAAQYIEDRGGICTLHRRFVSDKQYVEDWGRDDMTVLRNGVAFTKWEVWAEVEVR